MNANEILKKHEDANEMHFHEVDRKWIIEAMEEYAALRQPIVSGALPVDSAIKEIENLMERWHLARDNDDETLQGINDVLVNIGLLGWFNRQ